MQKHFCDLCGEPCEAGGRDTLPELDLEYGKPKDRIVEGKVVSVRPKIKGRLVLTVWDHMTGFGGPPDVCEYCKYGMLLEMARQFKLSIPLEGDLAEIKKAWGIIP